MSVREVTMYQVECNAPGCTVNTKDSGNDYWAWADESQAELDWDEGDGITTEDRKHWCLDHWTWCPGCESEEIPSYEGAPEKCAECAGGKTA